jgi:hypothetical protein
MKFDYRFKSRFGCVTNPFRSYLGSGKTITTICISYYRVKLFSNAIWLSNVGLKNFPSQIQERIQFVSSFLEIEEVMRKRKADTRIITTLDEAQNEFDKRMFGNKAQIHKTYFLNFFRKFNSELYFNVVNLNRLEFRLEDMCSNIYFPKLISDKKCRVLDIITGKIFSFNPSWFYDKYDTLEYIVPSFEKSSSFIIDKLTLDKTFKALIQVGSKLPVLRKFIQEKYHVSLDMAKLLYDLYVIKFMEKKQNANSNNT